MSAYPAAAGQGLYDSSTTQKHELGTVFCFEDSNGDPVWARYMKWAEGATIAAGKVVAQRVDGSYGEMDTTYASNAVPALLMGGLAASCGSTGFAWVVFRGRQTNASLAASAASSASVRFYRPDGSAALVTDASTAASNSNSILADQARNNICAYMETTDGTFATNAGNVIWVWR